jgi:hypothetical protein
MERANGSGRGGEGAMAGKCMSHPISALSSHFSLYFERGEGKKLT